MVHIEQQSIYLSQFVDSPIAPLLNEILHMEFGGFSDDTHNASDLALNLIISLKSNDREQALNYYKIFCKRQPNKDSHWIYDHFVLFAIVSAVRKFKLDAEWIRSVIDISYTGTDQLNKRIKDTLKNILAGNYNAKGDFHQISVVYQYLAKDDHYQDEPINSMFQHLWLKTFPFFEEDFLNIISLKAIEIAFLKKSLLNNQQLYYLNDFVPSFNRRADFVSKISASVIVIVLIFCLFLILWKLNNNQSQYPNVVKLIVFLGSFSGVGVFVFWGWKGKLARFFRTLIDKLFNYKGINIM